MSLTTWRITSIAVTIMAIVVTHPATRATAQAGLQVVATGLVNPRGLNFGPEGALYVAEAGSGGSGPCIVNSNGQLVCYGATGAVTRLSVDDPPSQARVVTGLPSLAGPTGASATGPHDVGFQGRGNGFVTIGAALDPARRFVDGAHPEFAAVGPKFGRLVRFQPNGKWSFAADLSAFELLENPDGGAFDSNPYGVLPEPGRVVFTDAGGNTLNALAANGSISNLAAFFDRLVPFGGGQVPMQAVPTTVARGPDGALYVGQLTGFPFQRVQRTSTVYLRTAELQRSSAAALPRSSISHLEQTDPCMSADQRGRRAAPGGGPGSLIHVSPDGATKTTIVPAGGGLVAPGGIAIDDEGSIYVTNHSVEPNGIGTVVRVVP
jgi:sugar lactone lactonase YvrE